MSVPKHRKTASRTKRGRSHHALKAANLAICAACGAPVKPHEACRACGYYAGRDKKKA